MSDFVDTLSNVQSLLLGFIGEGKVRDYLKAKKIPFAQIDVIFKSHDKWFIGEIKSQHKFETPPFDGHGLPQWQMERRLTIYKDTGIEPILFIYDLDDKCIYMQSLVKLNECEKHITNKSKRVIFNLKDFKKVEIQ